jgi:hypothetical protein
MFSLRRVSGPENADANPVQQGATFALARTPPDLLDVFADRVVVMA